jgi:hypothetical protein
MRHFILAGAFALACLQAIIGTQARAQDCKPLKMLGSAEMEVVDGVGTVVHVTINGKPAKLMLGTASGTTRFMPESAAALGLTPISDSRVTLISSKNKISESYVVIDDLSVGGAHIAHSQFMLSPVSQSSDPEIAGIMAADLLSHFDVEFDFAAGKLNLFAQDHCPGKVIYWKHAAVSVVPLSEFRPTANDSRTSYQGYLKRFEQMWVPVTLDGKSLPAQISTGGRSNMYSNTALAAFGVDANSPGSERSTDASDTESFHHRFSTLVFDGVTVTNPRFVVYPFHPADYARQFRRTDTRLARLDDGGRAFIMVGMDVLTKLHLFASFGEHRLFITEASGPPHSAPIQ